MNKYQPEKRYSTANYWWFVFTPMLLFLLLFALYMVFTTSDAQIANYSNLKKTSYNLIGSFIESIPTAPVVQAQ